MNVTGNLYIFIIVSLIYSDTALAQIEIENIRSDIIHSYTYTKKSYQNNLEKTSEQSSLFFETSSGQDSTKAPSDINNNSCKDICNVSNTMMIAILPGLFVHGAGHLYIKRYKTALILFVTELIAIPYAIGGENDETAVLLFAPWLYDLIAAPILCSRMNKKARSTALRPYMQKNQYGSIHAGVQLSIRF